MDPDGLTVSFISAVTEHEGRLYFGHLQDNFISYIGMDELGLPVDV